ncbi:hypothetical protein HZB74_00315 [Candidatus Saccharibacteria bacterium]|nr:hypothetical protein [Candidatus Saccharibacteria bacterium]
MRYTDKPPILVNFYSPGSLKAQGNYTKTLRLSSFHDSLRKKATDIKKIETIGSDLLMPPLSNYSVETWTLRKNILSRNKIISGDDRIILIKTSSKDYTFVRFICTESSIKKPAAHLLNDGSDEIRELTYLSYKKLVDLIKSSQLPENIIRTWNFIPGMFNDSKKINGKIISQRYEQFNKGRKGALMKYFNSVNHLGGTKTSAATVVGSKRGGPLIIEALLSNDKVFYISNPEQVDPQMYSKRYGKSPPLFSRASVQDLGGRGLLFISGTASIKGEDTKNPYEASSQVYTMLENLEALIDYKNLSNYVPFKPKRISLSDLQGVRVYIKDSKYLSHIEPVIKKVFGGQKICILNGEICRDDLLVEIESNATPI